MKSLFTRAVLIASLALGSSAAMAANLPAHKTARVVPHVRAAVRVAPRLPDGQYNADIGWFIQSMFGGGQVLFFLGESGYVKEFHLPPLLPFLDQMLRSTAANRSRAAEIIRR